MATHVHSTPENRPQPGQPSRRSIFSAGAALALATPAVAADFHRVDTGADTALLATYAHWQPHERERLAVMALDPNAPEWDERFEAVSDPWHEGVTAVMTLPARTPSGLQAKAAVLRALLENHIGFGGPRQEYASPSEAFAWSLTADLLGVAA